MTFREWLQAQQDRDDRIGDLARDMADRDDLPWDDADEFRARICYFGTMETVYAVVTAQLEWLRGELQ